MAGITSPVIWVARLAQHSGARWLWKCAQGAVPPVRSKKRNDGRTLAECVRAAKELLFGSETMIGHEMRELMGEALDLLADQEQR